MSTHVASQRDSIVSPVKTRTVPVGPHQIVVNESGPPDAPTIVFLHGSGPGATGASNWEAVMAEVGDTYHCIAPDVLGFGDSSHPQPLPAGLGPYTQLRVEVLVGLLDEMGVGRATIVGNSMGGMWALGLVRAVPDRVDKLVLMGAGGAPLPIGPSLPMLIQYYDDPSVAAMTALLNEFLYDPETLGGRLEEIAEARLPRANRPEIEASHRATFNFEHPWDLTEEDLAAITHDTLVIHGREDKFVSFDAGVWFFRHIQNARLYGIGRCGHWTQIEHHKLFVSALRSFMAGSL